ncbi:hypothetical protein L873DRAFT_820116 [Choiromyces venosus 120613-1]|uniref:Uncharacterized protein n=1 Tax=Choiromyces venosus 120613-1 TaxID=1336337 RepID=A0A3N4IWZ5_9PEZI|nr:hypothetical protein L873DRAFT_820116 [Choiromyces venosus 120613-1]
MYHSLHLPTRFSRKCLVLLWKLKPTNLSVRTQTTLVLSTCLMIYPNLLSLLSMHFSKIGFNNIRRHLLS